MLSQSIVNPRNDRIPASFSLPPISTTSTTPGCVVHCTCTPLFLSNPTKSRVAYSQAAGQNCIGIERFIVAAPIYSTFISAMTLRVKSLKLNDVLSHPAGKNLSDIERTDVGAMVTDRLFDKLEGLIEEAVKDGARLIVGGKRYVHPEFPTGHYFSPTLLVDVTPTMAIAQEELFSPVMLVMKFDLVGEAIVMANGTRYGLGASVFGRGEKECAYVVDRIKAGMVCTNG